MAPPHDAENSSNPGAATSEAGPAVRASLQSRIEDPRNDLSKVKFGDFMRHDTDEDIVACLPSLCRKLTLPGLGEKVNEPDSTGTTLLYRAVDNDSVNLVRFLLGYGADPDVISKGQVLPVWNIVKSEVVSDLLKVPAFVRLHPSYRVTTLTNDPESEFKNEYGSLPIERLLQGDTPWPSSPTRLKKYGVWLHVPSPSGLALLVAILSIEQTSPAIRKGNLISFFYNYFKRPHVAPRDPSLNYREPMYWSGSLYGGPFSEKNPWCSAIVFPCLRLNSMYQHKTRRGLNEKERAAMPVASSGDQYSRNLAFQPVVQLERTLDEAYYPGLGGSVLVKRNDDQVISRAFKNQGEPDDRIPLLIVPELWIWRIGETVLSAFSLPFHAACPWTQATKHQDYNSFGAHHIAWMITQQIKIFGEECNIGQTRFPPALDIFEAETISILFNVDEYLNQATPSSVNFKKERNFLHVLSDIRSELVMILHVLDQQKEILCSLLSDHNSFLSTVPENQRSHLGPDETSEQLDNAKDSLDNYKKRINKIDQDAERTEKAVQDMLDLKRTYANIKDAHSSLLLSAAVFGFTVITIVFAPLAFLTALFALKINGFGKLHVNRSDLDSAYRSDYIGAIFVSSEALTIAITAFAVLASLRYIRRWDRLDEDDVKKKAMLRKGKFKTLLAKVASKTAARKTDVELQPLEGSILMA